MANETIADQTDGGATIPSGALFLYELPSGGGTRKATLSQILQSLGIPVTTVAGIASSGSGNDMVAYATDGRKTSEGVGAGTGVLATAIDSSSYTTTDDGTTLNA